MNRHRPRRFLDETWLATLGAFLEDRLQGARCDGTHRGTKEFILVTGVARDSKRILRELARRGGCCCDCEVLSNAVPQAATRSLPRS